MKNKLGVEQSDEGRVSNSGSAPLARGLTDAEVLFQFMGWGLAPDQCKVCGWRYADKPTGCTPESCSMRPAPKTRADALPALTLDTIWEIEDWLTAGQVEAYLFALVGCAASIAAAAEAIHATAEQKIKALATVVRPMVEAGTRASGARIRMQTRPTPDCPNTE